MAQSLQILYQQDMCKQLYYRSKELGTQALTLFCSHCLTLSSTFALLSMPMLGADSSPSASTRAHRDALAASIREILPLFLGAV